MMQIYYISFKLMFCMYFRILDCVRSCKENPRILGLTFMGHLFKRQPAWLYKIASHSLLREVIKLLKVKTLDEIIESYCIVEYTI